MRHITGMLIPVKEVSKEWGDKCYTEGHEDRSAVKTLVMETDSWGSEYFPMCKECLDKHKAERQAEYENPTGHCEWCHKDGLYVSHRTDPGESCGPVYEVCSPCYHAAVEREFPRDPMDECDYD